MAQNYSVYLTDGDGIVLAEAKIERIGRPVFVPTVSENESSLFLSALSLCLSRACLGKIIVFGRQWHRKKICAVLVPGVQPQLGALRRDHARTLQKNGRPLFSQKRSVPFSTTFHGACPEPILVKRSFFKMFN